MPTNDLIQRRNKMLNEYYRQMIAAGYTREQIIRKVRDMGTIKVPKVLPENFGQGEAWTGGMQSELLPSKRTPQYPSVEGIPSPDDYMSYKAGQPANRLPNYAELMGQTQPTGKFGQTKQQNIMQALSDYLANYQGKTLGYDQGLMEAGVAGMPREYGAQLFQQYKQQGEQREWQKAQEPKNFILNLVKSGASPEELIAAAYSTGEPITMEQATALAKIGGWQDPTEAQKLEKGVNKKLQDFATSSGQINYAASLIDLIQQGTTLNTMKVEATKDGLMLDDEEWLWLYNKYSPKGKTTVGSSFGESTNSTKPKSSFVNYPQPTQKYRGQVEQMLANLKTAGAKF